MTVTIKAPRRGEQTLPLTDYVANALCDDNACRLERTDNEVHKLRHAYSRLILVLAEKGILDADDLDRIACGTPIASLNP